MNARTSFSLVVSCYNYEAYLEECLRSCLEQDYSQEHFEVVCVDDGSTDGSGRLMDGFKKKFGNLTCLHTENGGLEKACNRGIRASRHERIVRVDADDALAPDFLIKMDETIRRSPDFDFYYCKNYVEYYSPDKRSAKTLPEFDAAEIFSRGDFFATGTVYRKADLDAVGGFPEKVKNCGLENYAVVLALLANGKRGLAVPGASFNYRRHDTNMSLVKRQAIIAYGEKLLAGYGKPFQTNEFHPYGLQPDKAVNR